MKNAYIEVKHHVTFVTVASFHGLEFNRSNKALCPFHDEKTPSFHNYGSYAYCHGCGSKADIIDLECHFTGLKPYDAVRSLAKRYGVRINNDSRF